ncbi:MAG TPA: hypothetical protein VK982_11130 [Bacteroidales bacterium]|nr:hypothetical protein [Bacteroidales bacterium]
MSAQTSLFMEILKEQAIEKVSTKNNENFLIELKKGIESGKNIFLLYNEYGFKLNRHIHFTNKHTAHTDTGCGCEFCKARHKYASLKVNLHRRIKSYDTFLEYGIMQKKEEEKSIENFKEFEKTQRLKIDKARKRFYKIKNEINKLGITCL